MCPPLLLFLVFCLEPAESAIQNEHQEQRRRTKVLSVRHRFFAIAVVITTGRPRSTDVDLRDEESRKRERERKAQRTTGASEEEEEENGKTRGLYRCVCSHTDASRHLNASSIFLMVSRYQSVYLVPYFPTDFLSRCESRTIEMNHEESMHNILRNDFLKIKKVVIQFSVIFHVKHNRIIKLYTNPSIYLYKLVFKWKDIIDYRVKNCNSQR